MAELADVVTVESLWTLLEGSAAHVVVLDAEGRFVRVNQAWLRTLGYSREEVIGAPWLEFVHPDDRAAAERGAAELRAGAERPPAVFRARCRDGSYRVFKGTGPHVRGPRGVVLGFTLDVTDEVAAAAAQQAREELRAIVAAVTDYLVRVDADGRIEFINRTYAGTTVEQVVGTSVYNWLPPDHREPLRRAIARVLATGAPETVVLQGSGSDGGPTWYESRIAPLVEGGAARRVVFFSRDITAIKRAELEAARLQQAASVAALARGIAHDFNNLLQIAGASATLLAVEGDLRIVELAEEILGACDRGAELTQRLLTFARPRPAAPAPLAVGAALRATEPLLRRLLPPGQRLALSLDESVGTGLFDQAQLEQVILNLVVNASEAMVDGGAIEISTRPGREGDPRLAGGAAPAVVISVRDEGPGIAPEHLERLFEPFFSTKAEGAARGLGLAIVYGLVQANGAEIRVTSAPGRGARFDVFLAPAGPGDAAQAAAPALDGRETLLLVDANPAVRVAHARYLARFGYCVLEARDGEDALQVARDHAGPIDLLIVDGAGGEALLAALRRTSPGLRPLFLVGDPRAGGPAALSRPFTPERLVRAVRDALAQAEA